MKIMKLSLGLIADLIRNAETFKVVWKTRQREL